MKKAGKVGWHLMLAGLAFFEMTHSKTPLRRAFCGGCFGWHIGAAYDDMMTPESTEFLDPT